MNNSTPKNVVLLVSGTPDLVTATAALLQHGYSFQQIQNLATIVLIGGAGSLPDMLIENFQEVCVCTLGLPRPHVHKWREDEAALNASLLSLRGKCLVASNQLQSKDQRRLIENINPREFVFYDNGISSYANHQFDLSDWQEALSECRQFTSYLTHMHRFGRPDYLASFNNIALRSDSNYEVFTVLRKRGVRPEDTLPTGAVLILGTPFSRSTSEISQEEEKRIHKLLREIVGERHSGPVYFKAHPRATLQLYDQEADQVLVVPSELPIEAYVTSGQGVAYSFSSTALFTLADLYGWKTYRVSHPSIDKVFERRPQLAKMASMQEALRMEK